MFQLELHLPYFVWKEGRPHTKSNTKTKFEWRDLSFLQAETPRSRRRKTFVAHQAHFSLTIYGFNDWRWVAYAFDNNHFDDERFEHDLKEETFSSVGFQEEPIIAGTLHDANMPILDPREYFLRVTQSRLRQVLNYWQDIVSHIKRNIDEYVCNNLI